ncbi:MAG: hypothetical protein IJM21_10815 [Clostridia bacterium]|nr:hypothetical protein [Clostridia bacterium]
MQRYRPFEIKKKSVTGALIWAAGLALFAVVLFVGLMVLENHVVITDKGIFFDFSGREEPKEPLDMDFVQVPALEIEESESVTEREERYYPGMISDKAVYAMEFDLDADFGEKFEKLWHFNVNTVILRLRPASGVVSYRSEADGAKDHTDGKDIDVAALIGGLHGAGYRVYARISVYADATFAADNPASVLKSIEREEGWLDNGGNAWINPYSAVFNEYFDGLLAEYASFDFDGYLFENAAFPYAGKLSDAYYVDDSTEERGKEVDETAEAILAAIRGKPVYYVLDVPTILTEGRNEVTGVDIAKHGEKGIGIVPDLTVSSAGNLAYELSDAGYCQTIAYKDVAAALERAAGSQVLPMLAVRGKLSDTLRVSVEKAVKEIRTSSPGAYAVSLQETVYFPELFQVMGNEGEYLLGDVKTPPPEPETESGTAEEGEETESEPEEGETEEESEETSEEEKTGDGEEESSGTGSAGTEKPVEVIEPTIPAEPEESESEVPKDVEEDPFA